jgi:predicted RNA binding protein YcfA (HicA-like mRNA interferase family)
MGRCDKLLQKAKESPDSLRFEEICQLAECYHFQFKRQTGSHRIYNRPGFKTVMNFQNVGGKAKRYQVDQLLDAIEEITGEGEDNSDE